MENNEEKEGIIIEELLKSLEKARDGHTTMLHIT